MIKYHLTITIFNAFFEWKLTSRWKIDSVWFYDYDILMDKILHELSYSDINKFKLNLFECYKNDLSCIKISQFVNGDVIDTCLINLKYIKAAAMQTITNGTITIAAISPDPREPSIESLFPFCASSI